MTSVYYRTSLTQIPSAMKIRQTGKLPGVERGADETSGPGPILRQSLYIFEFSIDSRSLWKRIRIIRLYQGWDFSTESTHADR